jgi:calcineurin-like phosphoesterase family protein
MNRTFKFQTNARKTFFSSDWHLGHKREFVWQARGYNSPEAHTDGIINKVNEMVGELDHIIYVGDFCLNSLEEQFEDYISRIRCQNIYMLWGNHNNPIERLYKNEIKKMGHGEGCEVYPLRYKNIIFVGNYLELNIDGQMINVCHYPLQGWNHQRHGAWMIHGHEHGKLKSSLPENPKGKILDLGWDVFPYPVSFDALRQIMEGRELTTIGHHGE